MNKQLSHSMLSRNISESRRIKKSLTGHVAPVVITGAIPWRTSLCVKSLKPGIRRFHLRVSDLKTVAEIWYDVILRGIFSMSLKMLTILFAAWVLFVVILCHQLVVDSCNQFAHILQGWFNSKSYNCPSTCNEIQTDIEKVCLHKTPAKHKATLY